MTEWNIWEEEQEEKKKKKKKKGIRSTFFNWTVLWLSTVVHLCPFLFSLEAAGLIKIRAPFSMKAQLLFHIKSLIVQAH